MKKKHLPRKNSQTCRIRSLLLNINDNLHISHEDYGISIQEFETYFIALEQQGYITMIEGAEKFKSSSYIIANVEKFEKLKNNLYKIIDSMIIPIVVVLLEFATRKIPS